MSISQKDAVLALLLVPGIGNKTYKRLIDEFGSPQAVWQGPFSALKKLKAIPEKVLEKIQQGPDLSRVAVVKRALESLDAWILTMHDPEYPPLLKQISQPPAVLFGIGQKNALCQKAIAIVGSRKVSTYGKTVAERFACSLAEHGFSIVSGLALGADSYAHKGALKADGVTVAVKGCGLDVDYPAKNKGLIGRIVQKGAVITEFFPGIRPEPGNFPARNRIISGLAQAVLVVEAGPRSGSLITAYLGLEQNRDVMAIPGNIFSYNSKGCHELIRQGACLVTSVEDILEEIGGVVGEKELAQSRDMVNVASLSPEEKKVLDKLEAEPKHIDDIAAICQMSASQMGSVLLKLELKGMAINHPGGKYSIKI